MKRESKGRLRNSLELILLGWVSPRQGGGDKGKEEVNGSQLLRKSGAGERATLRKFPSEEKKEA